MAERLERQMAGDSQHETGSSAGEPSLNAAEARPPRLLYALSTLPWLLSAICAAIMLVTFLQVLAAYSAYPDRMNIAAMAVLGGWALLCIFACVFAAVLYRATQLRRRASRQTPPPSTSMPS